MIICTPGTCIQTDDNSYLGLHASRLHDGVHDEGQVGCEPCAKDLADAGPGGDHV